MIVNDKYKEYER